MEQTKDPIGNLLINHLPKFEIVLILNVILGAFLKDKEPTLGELLMSLSFAVLILLYLLMAFRDRGVGNAVSRFSQKLDYFGMGVTVLGIFFKLNDWTGANYILLSGMILLAVSVILVSIASIKNWSPKLNIFLIRSMIAIVTASLVLQFV